MIFGAAAVLGVATTSPREIRVSVSVISRGFTNSSFPHYITELSSSVFENSLLDIKHLLPSTAHLQEISVIQYALFDTAAESTGPPHLRVFHAPKPHNKLFKDLETFNSNLPSMQQKALPSFDSKTAPKTLPKFCRHSNQPRFRRCDTKQPKTPDTLRILSQDTASRSSAFGTFSY